MLLAVGDKTPFCSWLLFACEWRADRGTNRPFNISSKVKVPWHMGHLWPRMTGPMFYA